MPSTVGIVASGEDVLNDAVFWVDAGRSSVSSGALTNLGTGGSALDARFGSTSGTDSFDPTLLTYSSTNYLYLTGIAGNSVSCTAPATATQFAASPLGGGADTTGAVTGGTTFTFSTVGSWITIKLLNASSVVVAEFVVNAANMTSLTDAYGVVWAVNRSTSGKKTATVTRSTLLFGTDDYLEVADSDLLDFGASDSFTVMAVVRQWATPLSGGRFISKAGSGTITGWHIPNNGTTLTPLPTIGDGTTSTGVAAATLTAGQLSAIGMRVNRSTQQLVSYNGNTISATQNTTTIGSLANANPMRLGSAGAFAGSYCEMELVAAAVWRRALNTNEIATLTARYT